MPSVQMAKTGTGGHIQGGVTKYQQATDGSFTVDSRDVPALLAGGMSLAYSPPTPPIAAAVGRISASGTLSNGAVALANQPDVMRQVSVEFATGTAAISAGTLTIAYANDSGLLAENISLVCPASTTVTRFVSRGVWWISAMTVSGLTGGTAPWLRINTTTGISVPVDRTATSTTFTAERDAGATIALGTPSTVTAATIAPTTAPNGTVTYSFAYTYAAPVVL